MVRNISSNLLMSFLTVIRLCTETPTAGGRLFETGDEKLLQYAHEKEGAFPKSCFIIFSSTGDHGQFPC